MKGKLFLLEIEDTAVPGTYITIGGLRSTDFDVSQETIDTTNKGSGPWSEKESADILSASISGSGTFKDTAGEAAVKVCMFDLAGEGGFRITNANGDTFTGPFIMTSYRLGGEHNSDVTYSLALESAGPIVHVAA